jgi:small subunit ribosomal protein S1
VLEMDAEKRRLRLGMKQLVPTSLDEYIAEHKPGDQVTGRMMDMSHGRARVELGEGIHGICRVTAAAEAEEKAPAGKADLSALSSQLAAKWKGGASSGVSAREPVRAGQIRTFRIVRLDTAAKAIELELA